MKYRLAIAALSALILTGCAPPGTYKRVRNTIRSLAVRELGPADRYDVSTSRDSPDHLLKGKIARVEVHGVNVRPAPGYILDDVFICARNVQVDRHKRIVESADETVAKAIITDKSMSEMVDAEGTIEQASVSITPPNIRIAGRYKAFGALPVNIVATGKARTKGSAGVEFVSDRVTVDGIPYPLPISRAFDFSTLYPALLITNVELGDGQATLTGTLDWSKIKSE